MKAYRISTLIKRNASAFSLFNIVPFSSSSAANPRFSFFSDDNEEGSAVYRHVLKFQRPTTVDLLPHLVNSVSLIGSVDRPLQEFKIKGVNFGVYTHLRVKDSRNPNRTFRILLNMWNEMAEKCFTHLKADDFIFVSGPLVCFTNLDASGNQSFHYKVNVKELNYVAHPSLGSVFQKSKGSQVGADVDEDRMSKYKSQLHLWQVFFASPYEWWDNRRRKQNSREPDFRHKDTGEALWLHSSDPPWIKRQLQLLDSKMEEQGLGEEERSKSRSRVCNWVYNE